jgi:hypothetical protein
MWIIVLDMAILFFAKLIDNALSTTKTILIQKNKWILASIVLAVSNAIYFKIAKSIISDESDLALYIVSIASGVGCAMAMLVNNRFSKERTFVNVIMSDNVDAMKALRTFLAENKITNVATDSYTLDWETKTLTITAYAETKYESRLIDEYLAKSTWKYKRLVNDKPQKKKGT